MASIPSISQTVRDGALGLTALGSELHVKIGLATDGPVNEAQIFADPQAMRDVFKNGPLVESTVHAIKRTNRPVMVVRAAETDPGEVGTIDQSSTGPLITATGSEPNDAYELRVQILVGGAVATATFRWSLDGGDTWSQPIATAATYTIPDSGIQLQFPAGTYLAGELYSADCTPPAFDTTSLADALDAAIDAGVQWRLVHIVGYASSAADSATTAVAVQSVMAAAALVHRYAYAVIEAADDSDAALISAFASVAANRIMVAAGFCELGSEVRTGRSYKRPAAWPIVARIMSVAVSRDPGATADGPLEGITRLYRDEEKTPNLHPARFATLRTFRGIPGFYVTSGKMMSPFGSDYEHCTNRQVIDVASRVAYEGLFPYLNFDLTTGQAGLIDEVEARAIDAAVGGKLRTALLSPERPDASDVRFVLARNTNILSTSRLRGKTRVRPKGYARYIENEIALENPALAPTE